MNGHANGHANGFANGGAENIDVVIIGAGISGINAAYRVQTKLPDYSYKILEARGDIGGTWDLFKYPGIRSDSDFYTFGFEWNTWQKDHPIVPGSEIKEYLDQSVKKADIRRNIRFHHKVLRSEWSSEKKGWTLAVEADGHTRYIHARFLIVGTGYYDYNNPLKANIPGLDNFKGTLIHPQFWPEKLDYTNKKVVIIGSGATAVTLVPNMAPTAASVTMIQRSPTYIYSLPNSTRRWWSFLIPSFLQHKISRLAFIFLQRLTYLLCRKYPRQAKAILRMHSRRLLKGVLPVDPHFNPKYNPWDQRVCIAPDGDFYDALRGGKATVKTGIIKNVTENAVELENGEVIEADILVTATGLRISIAGGAELKVDGEKVDIGDKFMWNGSMIQDVPNATVILGYTNASWTLGADATALLTVRLLKYLDRRNAVAAVPRVADPSALTPKRLMDLSSTYLDVAQRLMPKAADQYPWKPRSSYYVDIWQAMFGRIDEGLESRMSIGEILDLPIALLSLPIVGFLALLTGPFRARKQKLNPQQTVARTLLLHVGYSILRRVVSRFSPLQIQSVSPSTTAEYKIYIWKKGLKDHTVDLGGGAKGHWLGNKEAKNVLIWIHGGGFACPANRGYFAFFGKFLSEMQAAGKDIAIFVVAYTLIPAGTYPTQLRQSVSALRYILKNTNRKADNVYFGGDSAGGNLVLGVLSHLAHPHPEIEALKLANGEEIGGATLFSPWTSLETVFPPQDTEPLGDLIHPLCAKSWAGGYLAGRARDNYTDARLAPLDWWHSVPVKKVLVTAGNYELLYPFIDDFQAKLKAGLGEDKVEYVVGQGEAHVAPMFNLMLGDKVETEQGKKAKEFFRELI
ncbi:putative flavin-binding monooxygenase [Talaromyces proteolyticus]|uniref:Flavin-binding monooxygenase n=1 Tax=Talaromyces proteolyticus TaxID=1131652 RepID=A0AAD4KYZ9_9EURO|nr:putative flavin-binding monooxygenase [Talaromyces proteolyticus]KAH8703597.1 putative flavin-binding monooxygenase [Talaromyces proteolyticus]